MPESGQTDSKKKRVCFAFEAQHTICFTKNEKTNLFNQLGLNLLHNLLKLEKMLLENIKTETLLVTLLAIGLIGLQNIFSRSTPAHPAKQIDYFQFTQNETINQALAIHGCHCSRLSLDFDQGFSATSTPLDFIDEICKNWLAARKCITLPGGECYGVSNDVHDLWYEPQVCDQSNVCARDKCLIDNHYLEQILPTLEGWYFQSNDWEVIPGTSEQCVTDMNSFVDADDRDIVDYGSEAGYTDEDYKDLTADAETDFCVGKADGRHHVEDDCTIFYVCQNESVSKLTRCKSHQLFDKVGLICDAIFFKIMNRGFIKIPVIILNILPGR